MKTIRTYVGNTAYPITDTITQPNEAGVQVPMHLTGQVSSIHLQAQDADTQLLAVDGAAQNLEDGTEEKWGDVAYTPATPDVAADRRYVAWWRLILLSGGVVDTPEFLWEVIPHGVLAPGAQVPTGVCTTWATNEDVNTYNSQAVDEDFTPWLVEASELLYLLSARQFPGHCQRTVRPQRQQCGCWQVLSRGHVVNSGLDWVRGMWVDESAAWSSYGCGTLSAVRLAGPVTTVNEVRISGTVIDPATYRVDQGEWLVRLTDPTTGSNPGWPGCQDMSLPAAAPGTFEVDYTWGRTPPLAGVRAAATLAWQLWLFDNPRGRQQCKLPAGWTSVSRQGVTVSRASVQKLSTEGTGIVGIDAFLNTANPQGLDRVPAVYSRDVQPYARRVG